jgi:hypothetical protein
MLSDTFKPDKRRFAATAAAIIIPIASSKAIERPCPLTFPAA